MASKEAVHAAAVQETTQEEARPQESRVANERSGWRFGLGDLKRT